MVEAKEFAFPCCQVIGLEAGQGPCMARGVAMLIAMKKDFATVIGPPAQPRSKATIAVDPALSVKIGDSEQGKAADPDMLLHKRNQPFQPPRVNGRDVMN
jgi:hypothetical protein